MAATNRYMNVSNCTFNSLPLSGIKRVGFDDGISTKKESADADGFPTVSVMDYQDPTITMDTIDAFLIYNQAAGVQKTLVIEVRDAYNGVTALGGGKSITMSNAQITQRSKDFTYREYGKQTLGWSAVSTDGSTSPIAIAAL